MAEIKASVICVPLHDGLFLTINGDNLKRKFTQKDGDKLKKILQGRNLRQIRSYLKTLGYNHLVKVSKMKKSSNS